MYINKYTILGKSLLERKAVWKEREKTHRRIFTPGQKFEVVQDIECYAILKKKLEKYRVPKHLPNAREFFDIMSPDLSFARVRRSADKALYKRFAGTAKQNEIYITGSIPINAPYEKRPGHVSTYTIMKDPIRACGILPLYMYILSTTIPYYWKSLHD